MKKTKHILLAVLAATFTPSIYADTHKADVFLNGGGVGFSSDSDINFEDSEIWGLNFGYTLSDKWTLEAAFSNFETEIEDSVVEVEGTQYRLDALYHLTKQNGWTPFVAFGVGDQDLDFNAGGSHRDTLLNLGAGLKRDLGKNFQLRGDFRNFFSLDNEYTELTFTLGLGYRFGVSASAPAPAPTPAPEPVKEVDSDGDGVFDSKDQCPATPRTHKVDSVGCSLKLTETVSIRLNITFDTAKAVIKPEFESEVAKLAEFMEQYADTVVTVEGHTDSQGSDSYNQKLSQSRADAVKAMLISRYGISPERVNAVGYGESKPVADNSTADGREQNRRVVGAVSSTVTKTQTK